MICVLGGGFFLITLGAVAHVLKERRRSQQSRALRFRTLRSTRRGLKTVCPSWSQVAACDKRDYDGSGQRAGPSTPLFGSLDMVLLSLRFEHLEPMSHQDGKGTALRSVNPSLEAHRTFRNAPGPTLKWRHKT